jgi:hypothetical protein
MSGGPDVAGPDNTATTVYETGNQFPDNQEPINAIPEEPGSSPAPGAGGPAPGNKASTIDKPLTPGKVPAVPVEETTKTDLASVVARAREDLKKMDDTD